MASPTSGDEADARARSATPSRKSQINPSPRGKSVPAPQRIEIQLIPKSPIKKSNPLAESWLPKATQIFYTEFNGQGEPGQDFSPGTLVAKKSSAEPKPRKSSLSVKPQVEKTKPDSAAKLQVCFEAPVPPAPERKSKTNKDTPCRNKLDVLLDVVSGGESIPSNLCECKEPGRRKYTSEDDSDMVWELINYLADEATKGAKVVGTYLIDKMGMTPSKRTPDPLCETSNNVAMVERKQSKPQSETGMVNDTIASSSKPPEDVKEEEKITPTTAKSKNDISNGQRADSSGRNKSEPKLTKPQPERQVKPEPQPEYTDSEMIVEEVLPETETASSVGDP